MAGTFEIYTDAKGEFRFRLKAGNGEIILTGESYKQRAGVDTGIESVRKNSQVDTHFELKTDAKGKPYFNLKAGNGEIIGVSESYSSEDACKNGMASVKANAPDAVVKGL